MYNRSFEDFIKNTKTPKYNNNLHSYPGKNPYHPNQKMLYNRDVRFEHFKHKVIYAFATIQTMDPTRVSFRQSRRFKKTKIFVIKCASIDPKDIWLKSQKEHAQKFLMERIGEIVANNLNINKINIESLYVAFHEYESFQGKLWFHPHLHVILRIVDHQKDFNLNSFARLMKIHRSSIKAFYNLDNYDYEQLLAELVHIGDINTLAFSRLPVYTFCGVDFNVIYMVKQEEWLRRYHKNTVDYSNVPKFMRHQPEDRLPHTIKRVPLHFAHKTDTVKLLFERSTKFVAKPKLHRESRNNKNY